MWQLRQHTISLCADQTNQGAAAPSVVSMNLLDQLQKTDNGYRLTMEGEQRTWDEMWAKAERAAGWVRAHGGGVACLMENTHDAVAVVIGGLLSGGTVVSLPLMHRGQNIEEYVRQTVRTALVVGVEHVLCTPSSKELFSAFEESLKPLRVSTFNEACEWGGPTLEADGGRLVQFTSGSTGVPRGIPLSAEKLGANIGAIAEYLECDEHSSITSWLPLSHDMGLVGATLTTWAVGGSATILSPESFVARPLSWIEALSESKASLSAAPNFALELVLKAWSRVGARRFDLSAMRSLIVGGEVVRADTLRRFSDALVQHGMHENALAPSYGMAEVGLAVSLGAPLRPWRVVGVGEESIAEGAPRIVTAAEAGLVAKPSRDGVLEVVVSGETLPGYSVTAESDGALGVDGPSLFGGYVGEGPRHAAHRTRDTGIVLEDGGVVVLGRSDDVIVVRGRNIHPEDIEDACQGVVRRGLVAAVSDGAGGMALVAEALSGDMDEHARLVRQAATKACGVAASRVVFVNRGTLEKTTSGKIRRRSIAARLQAGTLEVATDHRFRHTS